MVDSITIKKDRRKIKIWEEIRFVEEIFERRRYSEIDSDEFGRLGKGRC